MYLNFKKFNKNVLLSQKLIHLLLFDQFPVASSSILLLLQRRMGWSFEQLLIQTIFYLSHDLDSSKLDLNETQK